MHTVAAKFVPEVLEDMLQCANRDPEFLKSLVTGGKTWVYGYNPETKDQSSHPSSLMAKNHGRFGGVAGCFFLLPGHSAS